MGRSLPRGPKRRVHKHRPHIQFLERRVLLSGALDPSFGSGGIAKLGYVTSGDDLASTIASISGGKLLVGGRSLAADEAATLAQFAADGQLDPSFGNGGTVRLPVDWQSGVEHLLAVTGGFIIGGTPAAGASSTPTIEKVTAAGAIDNTWMGSTLGLGSPKAILAVSPPAAGAGDVLVVTAQSMAELKPDGSLDTAFGTGGMVAFGQGPTEFVPQAAALQTDGSIVVAGDQLTVATGATQAELQHYTPTGKLDATFGTGGSLLLSGVSTTQSLLTSVAVLPDKPNNTYLVGGTDVVVGDSNPHSIVAHVMTDGTLDPNFGTNGIQELVPDAGSADSLTQLAVEPDGSIAVTGTIKGSATIAAGIYVGRLTSDGQLDPGFNGTGLNAQPLPPTWTIDGGASITLQGNAGNIVLATGALTSFDSTDQIALERFAPDGSLDSAFGQGGAVLASVPAPQSVTVGQAIQQPDGGLVLTGGQNVVAGNFLAARFNADGTPDTSFGDGGIVNVDLGGLHDIANDVAIQPDSKLLLVGATDDANPADNFRQEYALTRLNQDGTVDSTFGAGGTVISDFGGTAQQFSRVALQGGGSILAEGAFTDATHAHVVLLAQYLANGQLDASFGNNGELLPKLPGTQPTVSSMWVTSGGLIVLEGVTNTGGITARFVARLNSNGTFDTTFGNKGVVVLDTGATSYSAIRFDPDAAGTIYSVGQSPSNAAVVITKLKDDGTIDTTFGAGGTAAVALQPTDTIDDVRHMPDGSFVLTGSRSTGSNASSLLVMQLTAAGQIDPSFGAAGFDVIDLGSGGAQGNNVFAGSTGGIVVTGEAGPMNSMHQFVGADQFAAVRFVGGVVAAPIANAGGPYGAIEGQTITLTAAASSGAITKYEWDLNYDGTPADFVATATGATTSLTAPEGPATQTIAVRVTGPGGSSIASTTVTIADAILSVTAPSTSMGAAGASITLTGTITDYTPDMPSGTWQVTGPNNFSAMAAGTGITFTPQDGGTYTAMFSATDADGNNASATTTVTVTGVGGKSIAGSVFNDANNDGVRDNGEIGLGGIIVYADLNNDGKLDPGDPTAATAADGSYALTGLTPGTNYTIREVVPAGYAETAPVGYSGSATAAADHVVAGPVFGDVLLSTVPMDFSYLVKLTRGYGKPGTFANGDLNGDGKIDFTDVVLLARNYGKRLTTWPVVPSSGGGSSITGTVFADTNNDGVQDNGETGLVGVTVYADLKNDGMPDSGDPSAITSADGSYTLSGLTAGTTYTIREVVPAGYAQTAPSGYSGQIVAAAGSVAGPVFGDVALSTVPMDFSYLVKLARGYGKPGTFANGDLNGDGKTDFNDLVILARAYGPKNFLTSWPVSTAPPLVSSITGTVFADTNNDGVQDNGETGLAGVTVYADLNSDGKLDPGDPSATTAADGSYTLTGLTAGTTYTIREVVPTGDAQTAPSGYSAPVTAASGSVTGPTFGDVALSSVHMDFSYLVKLARNYGKKAVTFANGDLNGDGTVGFDDLVILARNYGMTKTLSIWPAS